MMFCFSVKITAKFLTLLGTFYFLLESRTYIILLAVACGFTCVSPSIGDIEIKSSLCLLHMYLSSIQVDLKIRIKCAMFRRKTVTLGSSTPLTSVCFLFRVRTHRQSTRTALCYFDHGRDYYQ